MDLHLPAGLRHPHRPASVARPLRDRLAAHVASSTLSLLDPDRIEAHDSDGFWPERWEAGALYIHDLGYQSNDRFVEASLAHAHLLQRFKETVNPVVVASYGPTGYRRVLRHEDGSPMRLKEACTSGHVHQQEVLDLDVEVTDGEGRTILARVVCMPVDGEDHYYLSTLPRVTFAPFDLASCTGFAPRGCPGDHPTTPRPLIRERRQPRVALPGSSHREAEHGGDTLSPYPIVPRRQRQGTHRPALS